MKLLGPVIIFLISIHSGSSIRCYVCNSANNSMCLDLTKYKKEDLDKYLPLVECNPLEHGDPKYFCRKQAQKIFHKNHDTDYRVTRGCGWVLSDKPCYKTETVDHSETVCQCFKDGCNSAVDHRYSLAAVFTVITAFTLV